MERARRGEGSDDPGPSWPLMGDPAEDLSDLDEPDTRTMPGYLTLEMDVSDLRALAADSGAAAPPTDERPPQYPEPALEASDLELLEALAPEDLSLSGYLTLEVDFESLEDEPPGREERP